MSTSLIATYGIPCDVVEAGARVQAFAEIKAAELTRNLCIGKKLPTEIYQVINELFEKECFERAFSEWKLDALCCSGNCLPHHHYNDEQIADIIETELDGDTDLDKLNEHLVSRDGNTSNEDYQVHGERKTRIMGKMGLNGSRAAHNQLYLAHNKVLQHDTPFLFSTDFEHSACNENSGCKCTSPCVRSRGAWTSTSKTTSTSCRAASSQPT